MEAVDSWVLWLALAFLLGVAEVFTTYLVFGMVAGGAVGAAVAAWFGAPPVWQTAVFIVVAVGLLVFGRPIARRHMRQPPETRTGVAALVGMSAVVVERVDAHSGQIKLAGEIWTARSYDAIRAFEPGTTVDVIEIKGATALVYGPEP